MYNLALFSVASLCIFFTSYENKWQQKKKDYFCGFRMSGKSIFPHSPLSEQHSALTMATAMCLCQSAASPKHQNSAKNDKVAALFWLHSHNGWGIFSVSGMSKCSYPCTQWRKRHQFESNSTKPKQDTRKRIGQCLQG